MVDRKGVGIRIFVEGGELVKRGFNEIADSGRKMWSEIALGSRAANPAVIALSKGSEAAQVGIQGLASRAGTVGSALGVFGAAGLGAGAALGVLAIGLNQVREAMALGDVLGDTAAQLQIGVEALQEYRYALVVSGGSAEDADAAIGSFTQQLGQAEIGVKKSLQWFQRLGLTQEQLKSFGSAEEALNEVVNRIGELDKASERAAIADKLGIGALIPVINQGENALADLRREAQEVGYVMSEEVAKKLGDAQDKADVLSQVLKVQMAGAFADLAPVIIQTMKLINDMTGAIAQMITKINSWQGDAQKQFLAQPQWQQDAKRWMMNRNDISRRVLRDVIGIDPETGGRTVVSGDAVDSRAAWRRRAAAGGFDSQAPRTGRDILDSPSAGGAAAARARTGPSPEDLEALRRSIALEQDLVLARLRGDDSAERLLEQEQFLASQRDRYVKAGLSQSDAASRAQADADARAVARDAADARKAEADWLKRNTVTVDQNPNLVDGALPSLVVGPDGKAWSPEQRDAWARSVGDATADGLDVALRGGDVGEWLKSMFYRSALEGVSKGVSSALSGIDYSGVGNLLSAVGSNLFGPGFSMSSAPATGRAAGGDLRGGGVYQLGEHGRPELAMFGGGYVANAEATQRMLADAVGAAMGGGGASGARRAAGDLNLNVTSRLEIPPGVWSDRQFAAFVQQAQKAAVAEALGQAGYAAGSQQAEARFLKG